MNDVKLTTRLAYGLLSVWATFLRAFDQTTNGFLKVLVWLKAHPATSAMGVLSFYVVAGALLAMDHWLATPMFIFAVAFTLVGFLFFGDEA